MNKIIKFTIVLSFFFLQSELITAQYSHGVYIQKKEKQNTYYRFFPEDHIVRYVTHYSTGRGNLLNYYNLRMDKVF